MKYRRLFVAIDIPATLKSDLRLGMQACALQNIKWTLPENLHVTLVFLGKTPETGIPNLSDKLRGIAKSTHPFTMRYDGARIIYKRKRPVMIWGVFEESPAFKALADNLHKELNIEQKHEPNPHITLTRLKNMNYIGGSKLEPFNTIQTEPFTVDYFSLYESVLTEERAVYHVLETFKMPQGT